MNIITKYRNMSNDDLLRECRYRRNYSPIIEELCQRLENCEDNHLDLDDEEPEIGYTEATCPMCEAELKVIFDGEDFSVEVR